jgi:trimeric autotransporter adhesin
VSFKTTIENQKWRGSSTFVGEILTPGVGDSSTRLGGSSFVDDFMATAIGTGAGVGAGASYGIAIGGNARVDPGAYSAVAIRGRARGNNSISIGGDTSDESVAVGAGASTVGGLAGTALGYGATSTGQYGVAVGRSEAAGIAVAIGIAFARAQGSIAIGYLAQVPTDPTYPSPGAICMGLNSSVAKNSGGSIVIGDQAWTDPGGGATPNPTGNSIVMGANAYARTGGTIALGRYSGTATAALRGIAVGDIATCSGPYGIVIGASASVGGDSSICIGASSTVSGNYSTLVGSNTVTTADGAVALGFSSAVSQVYGIAVGQGATAVHARSGAIGQSAVSTAADRITLGLVGGSATQVKALQVSAGFAAFGGAPPASQPSHVADPSGGTTIDTEARAAINSILAVLEGAGLVASA